MKKVLIAYSSLTGKTEALSQKKSGLKFLKQLGCINSK